MSPNTVVAEFPEFPQEVGKAATPTWACRHFSVKELASIFKLSHDSVTRLFRSEPDVMVMAQRKRRGARTKKTLRIPEHVVNRVYERLTRRTA